MYVGTGTSTCCGDSIVRMYLAELLPWYPSTCVEIDYPMGRVHISYVLILGKRWPFIIDSVRWNIFLT